MRQWRSTANGRFGSPLRVVGVQHPAPPLACHVGRIKVSPADSAAVLSAISIGRPFNVQNVLAPIAGTVALPSGGTPSLETTATAPYVLLVLSGTALYSPRETPKTTMWFLVYVQAMQADGASVRNILIATEPGVFLTPDDDNIAAALNTYVATIKASKGPDRLAVAVFHQAQIEAILDSVHLPSSLPLSIIAVEFLPGGTGAEVGTPPAAEPAPVKIPVTIPTPAAAQGAAITQSAATPPAAVGTVDMAIAEPPIVNFPFGRILRVSPLTPIAPFC